MNATRPLTVMWGSTVVKQYFIQDILEGRFSSFAKYANLGRFIQGSRTFSWIKSVTTLLEIVAAQRS